MLNNLWPINDQNINLLHYGKYDYLKQVFDNYKFTIKTYYSTNNLRVSRPNPLVSILLQMEINIDDDIENVYTTLCDMESYIADQNNFIVTSTMNSKPFNNVVVPNSTEYFLSVSESFDFNDATIYNTPLACLYTSMDEILLTHPTKIKTKNTLQVYTIDIVKLGISFYHWSKQQVFTNSNLDPARFIFEVVYLNLIDSLLDYALLNRYINFSNHKEVTPFTDYNPFMVKDYTRQLGVLYKLILSKLHTKRNINEYLANIPAFSKANMLEVVQIPNGYYNKQNSWVVWLSRANVIVFLLNTIKHSLNQSTINDLMILLRYNINSKYFKTHDKDTTLLVESNVNKILKAK